MKLLLVFLCLLFSISVFSSSYNSIHLTVSKHDLDNYKVKDESYLFTEGHIMVNNDNGQITKKLSTRGQTSIRAPRRSFSVKLEEKVKFSVLTDNESASFDTKDFKLVSMWEDDGYVTAETGYSFFKTFGLFSPYITYAEIFLNNVSQGLYKVIDSPDSYAKKKLDAACFIRRGYGKTYEIDFPKEESDELYRKCERNYQEILKPQHGLKKQAMYDYLNARMNIKSYFQWLIINSLLESGDYSDEVFFYGVVDSKAPHGIRFEIMAWDPDDIFQKPHLSIQNILRSDRLEESLLMSLEAKLDRIIDGDKLLEKLLAQDMVVFLNELSDNQIDQILDAIKIKIEPYLDNPNVREMSKLDRLNRRIRKSGYTRNYVYQVLDGYKTRIKNRKYSLIERAKQI